MRDKLPPHSSALVAMPLKGMIVEKNGLLTLRDNKMGVAESKCTPRDSKLGVAKEFLTLSDSQTP